MWNKLLGINSFVLWPATIIFMVYSAGRAVMTLQWKMLVVAIVIFAIFTIVEIILGMMSD
jgi:hypothetical protein